MDRVTYLDFDLLIQRRGTGYHTQVLTAPAGQADAAFSLPFSDLELENFLLRIGRSRRSMRRIGSPEMEAAKTFGGRLFDALFGGEVRSAFRSSLEEAGRQRAGLRIRLRLADAPELHDLPWEFLYDLARNQFLVLSIETPLVRYLDLAERIRPLAMTPPIKVLVMISSPSDYPQLDVEQEWRRLHEALAPLQQRGLLTLERLETASLRALQRWLRQGACHIFHFIGHGGFDQASQDGLLILEDDHQRGRPVSGQDLGVLLHDHRLLRLAVLNACEGARTSHTDPFAGAAQSLVQHGIPAVIAMQFEITDAAAVTFAHEFYEAVADGYPVDAALAEARKAIFTQGNDVEWSTPVLYLRSPDGRIFDVERVTQTADALESEAAQRQRQFIALFDAAQAAAAVEDWAVAVEKLQMVLALHPGHTEAAAQLREAQEQRELALLYTSGQQHAAARRWQAALDAFRQVQARQNDYKEVRARLAAVQQAITREETPPVSPVSPVVPGPAAPQVPKARRVKVRRLRGALVLLLGVAGVLLWQNTLDNGLDSIPLPLTIVDPPAQTDKAPDIAPQDAEAQYRQGEQYAKGEGVPQDAVKAVEWYRKAAEQGHTLGQTNLGWMYANALGVSQDEAEAITWYREAAAQGHAEAQNNLRRMESPNAECPPEELSTLGGKVLPLYVQWHKSRHEQWEEDEIKDPILEAMAKEEGGQEGTARGRGAIFERMLSMLEAADAPKAKRVRSGLRASVVLQELRAGTDERKEAVARLEKAFGLSFPCLNRHRKALEYLALLNQMPNFPDPMVNPEGDLGEFLGAYMRKHAIVNHVQITQGIVLKALEAYKHVQPDAQQSVTKKASLELIEKALQKLDPKIAAEVRQGRGEKAHKAMLDGEAELTKRQTTATHEYEDAYQRLAKAYQEALSALAPVPLPHPSPPPPADKALRQDTPSRELRSTPPPAAPPVPSKGTPPPKRADSPPQGPRNPREPSPAPEKESPAWDIKIKK